MKKLMFACVLAIYAVTLFGCAAAASPVFASIYTDVKAPLTATSLGNSPKTGQAHCTSILGIVATGDASIQAAAANGGITKIHYVDYKSENILGIYAKFTTIVHGE